MSNKLTLAVLLVLACGAAYATEAVENAEAALIVVSPDHSAAASPGEASPREQAPGLPALSGAQEESALLGTPAATQDE